MVSKFHVNIFKVNAALTWPLFLGQMLIEFAFVEFLFLIVYVVENSRWGTHLHVHFDGFSEYRLHVGGN